LEVRLAYEQGVLRTSNPNPFQRWALSYWLYMDRRQQMDDRQAVQEKMTFDLFPERWKKLYLADLGIESVGGEEYEGVKEFYPSEVDAFIAKIESGGAGEMTGAEARFYGMEV
jgi:hypothetical protein